MSTRKSDRAQLPPSLPCCDAGSSARVDCQAVPASIMASATIRRRATLLTAMDQNCATPRFRGQRDALVETPRSLCTCFLAVVQTNMPRWSHKRASNGRNVRDNSRSCSPFLSWRIQNVRRLPVSRANNVERHRLEHVGVGTLESKRQYCGRRNRSGSRLMLTAMRRASSLVSDLAAARRPASSSK